MFSEKLDNDHIPTDVMIKKTLEQGRD